MLENEVIQKAFAFHQEIPVKIIVASIYAENLKKSLHENIGVIALLT